MHISYAIFLVIMFTFTIVKVKCPSNDILYLMRLLLPIGCGYVLYLPLMSMMMDIFICTEQAKETVFFDID